ncbi:MAG: FtsL-like putative cell division protein [Bacteroidetes bacterium]|nr:FtsL-like putative cell division protein [Bacteroidota bacterium]
MEEEVKNTASEPEKEKEEVRPVRKQGKITHGIQSIMGGDVLSRRTVLSNLPFLVFLAILAMLYIANTYYSEKTFKDIEKTKNELKELRYQYITAKATLLYYSKQTEIAKRVEPLGISGTTKPPYKIFYSKALLKKQTDSTGRTP